MFFTTDGSFWPESFPIFDFSLTFEETILQILPSGSFIFFASTVLLYYRQSPVRVRRGWLLWLKLAIAVFLVTLELASLVLRCLSTYRTDTTYPAASIDLAATLAIAAVIYVEHRHALRTSAMLGLYLAIGILIDGTKSRSFFLRDLVPSGSVAVASATTRLILLVLEEIPRKNLVIDPGLRNVSAGEATSGFFTRTFFIFLHPMLRIGFNGILAMRDLDSLGIEFSSRNLLSKLSASWPADKRSRRNSLFWACCIAWRAAILAIVVPRLLSTGFLFAQPFVMRSIISSVHEPNSSNNERGGLVGAVLFSFGGAAVCRAASTHMKNRLIARLRGGLLAQLFDKSFRLKISEARKQAAITLMSADFDNIATGFPQCVEIPFSLLESGLGMYFLARFIQLSCLSILIPLFVSTIAGILYGKYLGPAIKYWNIQIETRVAKTSRALSQLPAIKKLGLRLQIAGFIQNLRVIETKASRRYRCIEACSMGSGVIVDMMTPVIVITIALLSGAFGNKISAEVIFPILGIVALVQDPLVKLLKAYPCAMSMLACFERIQDFLCQEENSDPRLLLRRTSQDGAHSAGISTGQNTNYFLRFVNASVAPPGVSTPLLKNVNFSIPEGSIMAMYGGTGSGKTTLLQGMLGEAEILDGFLYVDESNLTAAFCGQVVYLPNGTVRDCIVGPCDYDPVWFNTVITYCKLVEDLQQLPNGENFVIGSDGTKLSGGQRQRIGIARSVYARTRAIIFDDIFSALDKDTAVDILHGLCGQGGLLRQSNCTVVISSYLVNCLQVADRLILIDPQGHVSCEPCRGNPVLQSQVATFLGQGSHVSVSHSQGDGNGHGSAPVSISSTGGELALKLRRKGDAKLYLLWIDSIGRMSMFLWCLLVLLMSLAETGAPIFVRIWAEVAPTDRIWLVGYALISVAGGVLSALSVFFIFVILSPRASIGLHGKLTTTVTQSTLGFLGNTDTGSLLNRYSTDMELLADHVPYAVYAFLYCGFTSIISIGIVLSGATYMAAIFPIILGLVLLIQCYYLRTSRQLRLLEIEAQTPLVSQLRETATGLVYIRGFGWQACYLSRCLRLLDESQRPFYFLLCSQTLLALVLDLLATLIAAILAAICLFAKDTTSPNATGLALLAILTISTSLNRLITYWTSMETSVGSLSRLRHFLQYTPIETKKEFVDLPANWPSQGQVQLKNVCARYVVDDKDQQAPVIRDVTLNISPGQKIGVMGRSGSGKSSLLAVLLGFLEYSGSVMIDGVDISTVQPDQLRSRIITISQELVELDGTIRDNMLPYEKSWGDNKNGPGEKDLAEAERKDQIIRETLVNLQIWDPIYCKQGLDTTLEDANYSHGELQLMCIARAVVRRRLSGSMLVLVDEATASVDHWRDQFVREMMRDYFQGCTIIVVAHREETIADSNRTIRMAAGRIAREDDHW